MDFIVYGVGAAIVLMGSIFYMVRTNKKRALEVEELNQHFPELNDQGVSVEQMRTKLKKMQKTETLPVVEELPMESVEETPKVEVEAVDQDSSDELETPGRYKRSIFHPSHFKKDSDQ